MPIVELAVTPMLDFQGVGLVIHVFVEVDAKIFRGSHFLAFTLEFVVCSQSVTSCILTGSSRVESRLMVVGF
jgi:hypothetical protein